MVKLVLSQPEIRRRESSDVSRYEERALSRPTFHNCSGRSERAAGGLGLQFSVNSVNEGLHVKWLLKCAVGA
jgi:hypothetical protein